MEAMKLEKRTAAERLEKMLLALYARADEACKKDQQHRLARIMRWIHKLEDGQRKAMDPKG